MQDVGNHGVLHYGSKGLRRPGGVWQMWNPYREALWGHHVKLGRWSLSCNGDPRMLRIPEWVGCLPREAVTQGVGGWREGGAAGSGLEEWGCRDLPSSYDFTTSPSCRHGTAEFSIHPLEFQSHFGWYFLVVPPFLPLGVEMLTLSHCMSKDAATGWFYRCWQLRDLPESQKRVWTYEQFGNLDC